MHLGASRRTATGANMDIMLWAVVEEDIPKLLSIASLAFSILREGFSISRAWDFASRERHLVTTSFPAVPSVFCFVFVINFIDVISVNVCKRNLCLLVGT